ncbi:ATPase family protein associated with various cellular activities (AAA) [Labedaea rhizosphaerae]|uniref:ATPase family protein associated with various cellular activities (AAA) n=1 Tax=Labedaea rhizosphaerae TaxID=598644 RepID=A0A4R6S8H1_LABRH|nr:ATPase family protein associated with various cellular activities (AAA) [Labedaea rhizosphaerae]
MELDTQEAHRLAGALIALIDGARHRVNPDGASPVVERITEHVGCALADMPNVSTRFDVWDHVNVDRGVQSYLAQRSPRAEWFGITGVHHTHADLLDMLAQAARSGAYQLGAVDYATAATGPDEAAEIVQFGLVRTTAPDGAPVVLALRGPVDYMPDTGCVLRVLAADRDTAAAVRAEIERLVRAHDVYRGQLLSFDVSEHRGNGLVSFLPRPVLDAHDVVLPSGVLAAVERHVVRSAEQSDRLRGHGQHLKRGVMLYGPPGTGKTHTVRYLMSRLAGRTVLVLSGRALVRMLPQAVSMARRLQPSVLVLEDVDLVAEERGAPGSSPVLFELLNRIDGVDADADVTFLLTTNRVDTVERALSERPGRVDLAVEIPKPDADGRERLLRLYAEGADLELPDASRIVADTDGVTASFMRELVRRAVSEQLHRVARDERVRLTEPVLREALDELLDQRNRLTRVIVGGR